MSAGGVRRGDVFWLDLSKHGGNLGKTRPVVVVQNDVGNRHSPVTIVVPIRDLHGDKLLPVMVPLKKGVAGLTKDSVIDAGHIASVPMASLGARADALPSEIVGYLDAALRRSLAI